MQTLHRLISYHNVKEARREMDEEETQRETKDSRYSFPLFSRGKTQEKEQRIWPSVRMSLK